MPTMRRLLWITIAIPGVLILTILVSLWLSDRDGVARDHYQSHRVNYVATPRP
jgi:hypothetical protein